MSSLRKFLTRPEPYLASLTLFLALVVLDLGRAPGRQVTAAAYARTVHLYQRFGRPALAGYVRCRYVPSCSEYSVEAVMRYGLVRGLAMTVRRIRSCQVTVPVGTPDPVAGRRNDVAQLPVCDSACALRPFRPRLLARRAGG